VFKSVSESNLINWTKWVGQVVLRQVIFCANSILERSDIPHSSGLSGSEIPIFRERLPFSMRKYEGKLASQFVQFIDLVSLRKTCCGFFAKSRVYEFRQNQMGQITVSFLISPSANFPFSLRALVHNLDVGHISTPPCENMLHCSLCS
jgi:hypothetical protein